MKKDTVRPQDRMDAAANLRIACELSSLEQLAPVRRVPGVRKFRSVEDMSRERERWEAMSARRGGLL